MAKNPGSAQSFNNVETLEMLTDYRTFKNGVIMCISTPIVNTEKPFVIFTVRAFSSVWNHGSRVNFQRALNNVVSSGFRPKHVCNTEKTGLCAAHGLRLAGFAWNKMPINNSQVSVFMQNKWRRERV